MEAIQKSKLISIQTTTSKHILENVSNHKNQTGSQSALKLTDQSIRLKLMGKSRKRIEIEEISSPISPLDQSVVLCHILEHNFSLIEQIEMRRVCRLWQDSVEHIWGKARSLVLSLDDCTNKPTLSAKHKRNFEFEYHFENLQTMNNNVELTIGKSHWNQPTIDLLEDLFRNIEHLTIFYELSCDFESTEKLCHFLQKYPKIKSFSFLMPVPCHVRMNFLSRLFKMMINAHLTQLHTMHLYLPNFNLPFPALKSKHFHRILPFLQNFSLNCAVENLREMLQTIGKSLPGCLPMQSLSINVGHEKSLSLVPTLFDQNPKLSQIKRLQLTDLNDLSLNIIKNLLNHFTKVEFLHLNKRPTFYSKIDFTAEWIETLSKLPYLKELHLGDFNIQLYDHDCMVKSSLRNILKLNIVASYSLDFEIKNQYYQKNETEWTDSVEPSLMYDKFVHSLAKQFPKLEQLTIRLIYDNFDEEENFSSLCFAEFYHLKSLRLTGRYRELTFTS